MFPSFGFTSLRQHAAAQPSQEHQHQHQPHSSQQNQYRGISSTRDQQASIAHPVLRVAQQHSRMQSSTTNAHQSRHLNFHPEAEEEVVDFFTETSYVNVHEADADEVDILLSGGDPGTHSSSSSSWRLGGPSYGSDYSYVNSQRRAQPGGRLDALAVLLSGSLSSRSMNQKSTTDQQSISTSPVLAVEKLVTLSEQATHEMNRAAKLKRNGRDEGCERREDKQALSSNCGYLQDAVEAHGNAARLFYEAAIVLQQQTQTVQDENFSTRAAQSPASSLARSFLLLSQTEAKSAIGLQRVLKLNRIRPSIKKLTPHSDNSATQQTSEKALVVQPQEDRIRETVRGAWSRTAPEEDLSESAFLGKAKGSTDNRDKLTKQQQLLPKDSTKNDQRIPSTTHAPNPIDEMMNLERELRDMDMALELGNSIASLDTTTTILTTASAANQYPSIGNKKSSSSRIKTLDGSFMVVPSSSSNSLSASYLSSSMVLPVTVTTSKNNILSAPPRPKQTHHPHSIGATGTAGVRARANRVQSVSKPVTTQQRQQPIVAPAPSSASRTPGAIVDNSSGLESSWWGNTSTITSAHNTGNNSLASSFLSESAVAATPVATSGGAVESAEVTTNNKQLLRLMDSLKRLGDENAALLREVEQAEAARTEAKAIKQEMQRFKQEYNKRFEALKDILHRFNKSAAAAGQQEQIPSSHLTINKNNPTASQPTASNVLASSQYMIAASTSEQLARQEHLIRKLTMDLKKEKEEAKKKEVVFRRYESFYRDVKAMSAQKAAQRKQQQQQEAQKQSSLAPEQQNSQQISKQRSPQQASPRPRSQNRVAGVRRSPGSSAAK